MTPRAILTREENTDDGVFGRLTVGEATFFSGELPWRDNTPNISCIPPGTYRCSFTFSPRFRRFLYLVIDVPERSGIRFHAANLMGDVGKGRRSHLNGCIALGERLGWIEGQKAILMSVPAMLRFERTLARGDFTLEVANGFSR
jgi:hypothetical protein